MAEESVLTVPVSERDHAEGPVDAPLTLVEYGDYQCPYCAAAFPVVKELQQVFKKKLRFVFRNFPLTHVHPDAMIAAKGAEAAARQGKFWEMHDLMYKQQALLDPDMVVTWAKSLGLNAEGFKADLVSPAVAKRIKEDRSSGIRSGVNGTPTFYINGLRHNAPASVEALRAALDSALRSLTTTPGK